MAILILALKSLWRDLRSGELNLIGLAVVFAVASQSSIGFLSDRASAALERQANQLLGADLLLKSDHPWSPSLTDEIRARGLQVVTNTLFSSMALGIEGAQLVGVKAVESGYPLRGMVRVAQGVGEPDEVAQGIPSPGEAWLDSRLMATLHVRPGDRFRLGDLELQATRVITWESDRGANFFSLLPRVLINSVDLPATGLIQEGSRVTWQLQVAGAVASVLAFRESLVGRLERGQAIESVDNARPELRPALEQAKRFLRLAALSAVVLAAVAIGLGAHAYMQRHLDSCAILRCLGLRQRDLATMVGLEFLILGLGASSLGALLGWGAQSVLAGALATILAMELPPPSWLPVWQALIAGTGLLLVFALPALHRLSGVPTLRVLRRELSSRLPATRALWVLAIITLGALILWVAGDVSLGLNVMVGFVAALGVFSAVAWVVVGIVTRVAARQRTAGWRLGFAAVARRKGSAVLQVVALGLGLSALLLLTVVQADLKRGWRQSAPPDAPNRFIINIQPDQREAVSAFIQTNLGFTPPVAPMIRGRMIAINGRPVNGDTFDTPRAKRLAEREFNLSRGEALPPGNQVVQGAWHGESQTAQFSVEEGIAQTLGLKLGDRVAFEVAGRQIEAPITSVRALEWGSMRVNFFFIASLGTLDDLPASLITSFHLPNGHDDFGGALVQAFPNLSFIDVSAILAQLEAVMNQLMNLVRWVFGFALLAGLMVLWAAVEGAQEERAFEFALLRTLGGRDRPLRTALLTEFGVIGATAGALAGLAASGLGWLLADRVFQLPQYQPNLLAPMVGLAVGGLTVMVLGFLGARGVLSRPPLASLRGEG